ncbi:MAG: elongation factor G [Phycisphaerae bacterium]
MAAYSTADIRNVAIIGHGASGKTSLAEALLHLTGATNRLGSVADKSSHLDTDDEEKERGFSIDSHVCHVTHAGKHINLVDTPGAPDLLGQAIAALAGVETAVVVINAAAGIQVNTRKMYEHAKAFGLARIVVVNRIDAETANLEETLKLLRETFGAELTPFNLPVGKHKGVVGCFDSRGAAGDGKPDFGSPAEARTAIIERVVETDDAMMTRYLDTGEADIAAVVRQAPAALAAGALVPLVFTDARHEVGVKELLDIVAHFAPDPVAGKRRTAVHGSDEKPIEPRPDAPFCGIIFKCHYESKSNIKYVFVRVLAGKLHADNTLLTPGEKKGARAGHLLRFQGAAHAEIEEAVAGDLVAIAKLDLPIGTTLYTAPTDGAVRAPRFPTPMFSLALTPKARGDEAKLGDALRRIADVDPCFKTRHDPQTNELVASGIGDLHLRIVMARMHRQSKLDVNTHPPKIPYRETIVAKADGHYRHKKQTGGAGQFGEVYLTVSPIARGSDPAMEWSWDIFGGSIPGNFESAIKKGAMELMEQGAIAGFPMQDIKVSITDGKHHPVDSKEVAFKIAGKLAFKDAILKASPTLLEPIVDVEVTVPTENVGDVTGDLAQRRGRPQGQDMLPGNLAVIRAQAPLAKMADYHSRLSSITGGKGSFAMEFSHYEPVPGNEAQAIVAAYKPRKEEEE